MSNIELPNRYAEIQWTQDNGATSAMRGYEADLKKISQELETAGIKVTWHYLDKTNDQLLDERAKRV